MKEKLRQFGSYIDRLIVHDNLTRKETKDLMDEILKNEQTELHQGAFLAAITAKGPSPQEIAGIWESIYQLDTNKVNIEINSPLVENCGTGMDSIKTFNISTAASIIAASGGVYLARHGARAITSKCGTVDLCEALGIDVECSIDIVERSIKMTKIGLFNGMSPEVHPNALFRILSKMSFGSILNIAASLANPAMPVYGVRGVYSREMIIPTIKTMIEIGYKKVFVYSGYDEEEHEAMDEISPIGKTYVAEFTNGKIREYTITPEEIGIDKRPKIEEILGGRDPEHEALRLLKVLSGKDINGLAKTICLNTAPIFYIVGSVNSLYEGYKKAEDLLKQGVPLRQLELWIRYQNRNSKQGQSQLKTLLEKLN